MWEEPLLPSVNHGIPTLVTGLSDQQVVKLSKGPVLTKDPDDKLDFWGLLHSWGAKWMWEGIEAGQDTPYDMTWIAEGMMNNSLICITDGLYDMKKVIDLCGVGWIIFCSKTGFRLTGTFWEKSISASLLRAEVLGLCTLHLLAGGALQG